MAEIKKFIHIDMDCFYAAVEMRDNPSLRGVPIAIGGYSRRGVLATSNYEARKYGVRAAMSNYKALQLCPHLVLVPGRMNVYKEVSKQIREIFYRYTDLVEPLSLDEAYLDVTNCSAYHGSATLIANAIRAEIESVTGLTASAGIAPIKFVAKVASDENKPNGYCVISPERVSSFLLSLNLKKIPGVGKVTLEKLNAAGLFTGRDVVNIGYNSMVARYGNWGGALFRKCNGEVEGQVHTDHVRKSLSVEHTYEYDKTTLEQCYAEFGALKQELIKRIEKQGLQNRICKLSVKVKFNDFVATTADQASHHIDDDIFKALLKKAYLRGHQKGVRLLGLGVGVAQDELSEMGQLSLVMP